MKRKYFMSEPDSFSKSKKKISKIRPRKGKFFNFLFFLNFFIGILLAMNFLETYAAIKAFVFANVASLLLWVFWIRRVFVFDVHPEYVVGPVSCFYRGKLNIMYVDLQRTRSLLEVPGRIGFYRIYALQDELIFLFPKALFSLKQLRKALTFIEANTHAK